MRRRGLFGWFAGLIAAPAAAGGGIGGTGAIDTLAGQSLATGKAIRMVRRATPIGLEGVSDVKASIAAIVSNVEAAQSRLNASISGLPLPVHPAARVEAPYFLAAHPNCVPLLQSALPGAPSEPASGLDRAL